MALIDPNNRDIDPNGGGDGGPGAADAGAAAEVEARARRQGWRPKEEFRGDPAKWVPADEFLRVGETEWPVLRERLRRQDQTLADQTRKLDEQNKRLVEMSTVLTEFRDYSAASEQRAYERAKKDLESKMREAVTSGDVAAHEQARTEFEALQPPKKPAAPPAPEPTRTVDPNNPPPLPPEVRAWVGKNPWYETDPELNDFAVVRHRSLLRTNPELSLEENLERVSAEVHQRYPEKFENPARRAPARVGGDDNNPRPARRTGRSYADLPDDAKAEHDRFTKIKVKDPKTGKDVPFMTSEQYLADYPWDAP